MKIYALICCLLLASPALAGDPKLTEDFLEFVDLVPMDEVAEIAMKYVETPEFLGILDYIYNNQEFKNIILGFEETSEYVEFLRFLDESGMEVYSYLEALHEALGLPPPSIPVPLSKYRDLQTRGVMADMCDEIEALFPKDKIRSLHQEKLSSSSAFKYFVDRISSPEMISAIEKLMSNPSFASSIATLERNGIDISRSMEMMVSLFGFK